MVSLEVRRAAYRVAQVSRGMLCPQELMQQWTVHGVPEDVRELIAMDAEKRALHEPVKQQRQRHNLRGRRSTVRPCPHGRR